MSRASRRSAPAHSRPFGSRSARSTGGNGSSGPSHGTTSALHLLPAIRVELGDDRGRADRLLGRCAALELEPDRILGEKLLEHLAAQRADRIELVTAWHVLEQDGGERLRRRTRDDAGAARRIVLTVLRAAVDHIGVAIAGAPLGAVADEADLARRIRELVGADRGVRDDRALRP